MNERVYEAFCIVFLRCESSIFCIVSFSIYRRYLLCATIFDIFASFCFVFYNHSHHYSWALPCECWCCHCIISFLAFIDSADSMSLAEGDIPNLRRLLDHHCFSLLNRLPWRQGSIYYPRSMLLETLTRHTYAPKTWRRCKLWSLSVTDLISNCREWQMRPFQEVLIDLILDKSIKCVTNFLSLRIQLPILARDLEVLLLTTLFVFFAFTNEIGSFFLWGHDLSVHGGRTVTAHWVIAVVKFVRVDKTALVFVLGIGFDPLVRELTFKRLIVCWIASCVDFTCNVTSSNGWWIVTDSIISNSIWIFDTKLLLVASAGQDIVTTSTFTLLSLFGNEALLG